MKETNPHLPKHQIMRYSLTSIQFAASSIVTLISVILFFLQIMTPTLVLIDLFIYSFIRLCYIPHGPS